MTAARFVLAAALALATVIPGTAVMAAAPAPVHYTYWGVTTTFADDGTTTCAMRFRVPQGGQTLTLDARKAPKRTTLVDSLTLGGLPPLLAGKSTAMYHISLAIGPWSADDLKGTWHKGTADNNSSIQFFASDHAGALFSPLTRAGQLRIVFALAGKDHSYSFDLGGIGTPLKAYAKCLNG